MKERQNTREGLRWQVSSQRPEGGRRSRRGEWLVVLNASKMSVSERHVDRSETHTHG